MRHDRWRQIDELFAAALEREGADERAAFLASACAGDDALRREVEKMLGFDRQAEDFIETSLFGVAARLMTGQPDAAESPSAASAAPDIAAKKDASRRSPIHTTSGSIDDARFIPGDVLAERYRIGGLLGRGGMGEVYRADDLKLKQPVALKFLPDTLAADGVALARFYQEVSVARQISHRHVCRVYDVGEFEGQPFISMEFVRGEELASLLKRINRLPHDKAVEVARQLCGGLAAIHDKGVLHRDLKPANIMLDERGEVRITDFGIAALTESLGGAREAAVGTPAYMSPEQLAGRELTVASDIYSLGLVLYEVFTGKRAFEAANVVDMLRLRRSDTEPTNPSKLIADLDPLVERVILRCLERDAGARPVSALQVAAALPGGDPLAAALAAGETPSPEMVAAAPKQGSLRPPIALALLASVVISVVIAVLLSGRVSLHRFVPLTKSPDDLKARASEIAKRAGYDAPPLDTVHGFNAEYEYVDFVRKQDASRDRWEKLKTGQPAAITFWYRQSPRYLEAYDYWRIDPGNPPNDLSGMLLVKLDTTGRLTYFEAAPPQVDETSNVDANVNASSNASLNSNSNENSNVNANSLADSNANANVDVNSNANVKAAPDWSQLFREAGLDLANFRATESRWTPPHHADARAAWEGTYPGRPELPLKVEAAAYRGKPVYFELIGSWQRPNRQTPFEPSVAQKTFATLLLTFYFGALLLGALLAWRNLQLGRGDRRGAFRLALFTFALRMLHWIFFAHHIPAVGEVAQVIAGLQSAIYWAFFMGMMYLALEPYLRRRWPEWIISWSRLLAGDFRDPLVGRDVLIGATFGLGVVLVNHAMVLVPPMFGRNPLSLALNSNLLYEHGLLGLSNFIPLLMNQTAASIMFPFIIVCVLLFFTMLLRRKRLGLAASWLLFYLAINLNFGDASLPSMVLGALLPTILLGVLTRFGLLALISTHFFTHILPFYPVTTDFSAWHATNYLLQLFVMAVLLLYAFHTSLAGQPIFRGRFLED
ncbi:MAG: eukaryotic-like serine/threonine-protein kinase [Pyrinomonadaceae bacterium]|nr:eukaryotic-like serine/threonine-protein kinase [Pyrinomonadaceae bacterium]